MIEKRFKVVRIERMADSNPLFAPMIEETEELAKVGAEIVVVDCATEEETIRAAKDADAVTTELSRITRKIMEGLPKLKVIARYGIGYDNIDVNAATDNGIVVVNVPDYCWEEVSNHSLALLLACTRKIVLFHECIRQGQWIKSRQFMLPMGSLYGQTLGLVGCGSIGRITAKKAKCFGLKILGYDPYLDKSLAEESGITLVSLSELLNESDFISVHTPLTKETRHLIGEKEFKQMQSTAYFINTARGAVVDEAALIKALQEKWIAGAGIDVFEKEPFDLDNPLLKMDTVILTPHVAYYSDAASKRLRTSVGQEVARALSGRCPKNVVNKSAKPKVILTRGTDSH